MQVTITEAARLVGMSEKTLRRKIAAGQLSVQVTGQGGQVRKLIDTSELLRVFGSLPGQAAAHVEGESPNSSKVSLDMPTQSEAALREVIEAKDMLIGVLRTQLDDRTREAQDLRGQVGSLLEYRRPDVSTQAPAVLGPTVTRRELFLAAAVAVVVACVVAWANGYRLWFML